MATLVSTMKTNLYIGFVLICGLAALALGGGVAAALSVVCVAGILGTACNDYAVVRV
jgi:hypothetical protein